LDDAEFWEPVMAALEDVNGEADCKDTFLRVGIIDSDDVDIAERAKIGPAGRSLALPDEASSERLIARLAAGFVRSTPGELAVPYVSGTRVEND
jgi:hypothetical protein